MQWFTNNGEADQSHLVQSYQKGLSDGAIAGITIAVLIIIVLLLALLWQRVPRVRNIGNYIQNEIIWQPRSVFLNIFSEAKICNLMENHRSGEPLWAETARLLVRFILLFLFLAFVAYSIYRSVESPVVIQEIRISTDIVQAPGKAIREINIHFINF